MTVYGEVSKTRGRKSKLLPREKQLPTAADLGLTKKQVQTNALNIEVRAQCRLADEFDAAQKRGEVIGAKGGNPKLKRSNQERLATVSDVGLTRKQVHEARQVRDVEKKNPGVIKKAIEQKLAAGKS
jgi:hypothetical protein